MYFNQYILFLLYIMQRRIKYWNEYKNPFYYWWKVRKLFKYKSKWFIGKYYWTFGDYIKESPVSLDSEVLVGKLNIMIIGLSGLHVFTLNSLNGKYVM